MDDQSALAPEAGPEVVAAEAPVDIEGQAENQTAEPKPEGDGEDEKTSAQKRREREKAQKLRLRQERDAALAAAEAEAGRRERILSAAKEATPPNEKDYADPLEYVAAKAVWAAGQQLTEREVREIGEREAEARRIVQAKEAEEQALINQTWASQVADAKTRYSDFDQVALAENLPVSRDMARLIQTSSAGPDVLYHLGRNPALAAEIAAMSPYEAARAIGRLEATVTLPRPRTSTNAPDPIAPVKGATPATKDPARMSYAEFAKAREKGWTPKI